MNRDSNNTALPNLSNDEVLSQMLRIISPYQNINNQKGIPQSELNNIAKISYTQIKYLNNTTKNCIICFENFDNIDENNIYNLKCNHIFHVKCLNIWADSNKVCPYCKVYIE